jgi:hypothetical protein
MAVYKIYKYGKRFRFAPSFNKSLEGQNALKKGLMEAMFDFIITEMDLLSEICLRIELKKLKIVSDQQTFLV